MPGLFSQSLSDPVDTIFRIRVTEDILGNLFDQVGVRCIGIKERNFIAEAGAGLFQTFGLEFKNGQTRL